MVGIENVLQRLKQVVRINSEKPNSIPAPWLRWQALKLASAYLTHNLRES
jgi:hypothetical protein